MDERRFGLVIRALRRRRGWRQIELAAAAGLGQSSVSRIERGHVGSHSYDALTRLAHALDARLDLDLRWRGGEIDRLRDDRHATLSAAVVRDLTSLGWVCQVEVSYSHFGERGSIDILAWHASSATVLVIEIKTELTSAEATLRKFDEKLRLARVTARERFGWRADIVAAVLVLEDDTTNRRHLARHATLVQAALPAGSRAVRRWLRAPTGALRGVWIRSAPRASGTARASGTDGTRPRTTQRVVAPRCQ